MKQEIRKEDLEFLKIQLQSTVPCRMEDSEDLIEHWYGKLLIPGFLDEDEQNDIDLDVGQVEFYKLMPASPEDLWQACDDDSIQLSNLWTACEKEFEENCLFSPILYIHLVELAPEARGHGVGLQVMENIIERFGRDCENIVCKPFPITMKATDPEFRKSKQKLRNHWSRIGFTRIRRTDYFRYKPFGCIAEAPPKK